MTDKTTLSKRADKKIAFLISRGGEVVREAKIIRFPDNSQCIVDAKGSTFWIKIACH